MTVSGEELPSHTRACAIAVDERGVPAPSGYPNIPAQRARQAPRPPILTVKLIVHDAVLALEALETPIMEEVTLCRGCARVARGHPDVAVGVRRVDRLVALHTARVVRDYHRPVDILRVGGEVGPGARFLVGSRRQVARL